MDNNYGRLSNRSPLLARILQQMQQTQSYQPQSYGALAAGLGAAYFDKKGLEKELAREQKAKDAQSNALRDALIKYSRQFEGGPVNIPLGNLDGTTQQLQQNYMADPQGARQGLAGALAGLGMPEQAFSLAMAPSEMPELVGQANEDGTTTLVPKRPGVTTERPKPKGPQSQIGQLQSDFDNGLISESQYNTALEIMRKPLVAVSPENKPLTDTAKLRDDLAAGRITQEDFDRAITSHRQASGEILIKQGLLNASKKSLDEARGILFKDGAYRSGLVTQMLSPIRTGNAASLYTAMREAVANRLRAESGATITDKEIDDQLERFMPKPWEGGDIAKQKFDRFEQFIDTIGESLGVKEEQNKPAGNVIRYDKDGNRL